MDFVTILRALNFVTDFDPFQADTKEGELSDDKWIRARRKWGKWINLIVALISVRSLIMFFLIRFSHLYQFKWLMEKWGSAFSEMNIFVPLFTLNGPLYIIFAHIVLPRLIRSSTFVVDITAIKFIMKPEREISRLDGTISHTIQELIECNERKRANMLNQLDELSEGRSSACRCPRYQQSGGSIWKGFNECLCELIKLRETSTGTKFRPNTYSYSSLDRFRARARFYAALLFMICHIVVIILLTVTLLKLLEERCMELEIEPARCHVTTAFSLRTLPKAFDMLITCTLNGLNFFYILLLASISFDAQLNLIGDFHRDLISCLDRLHHINGRLLPMSERKVFKVVQETLIKIRVFDWNAKKGARTLATLLSLFIISGIAVTSGIFIGFGIAVKSRGSSISESVVVGLLIFAWIIFNIPANLNAYTKARINEAFSVYWPIRAELVHYLNRNPASRLPMGHLVGQWVELERCWFGSNTDQYIARPLGLNLTYHSVIELNFYVISIISFLFR